MSAVIDQIRRWEITLKEADAVVQIAANPGEDQIQLRWAPCWEPSRCFNFKDGNFPGFYVLVRYTREEMKEYRTNLKRFRQQLRASGKDAGIIDLKIGSRTMVGVFYNEDDFSELVDALGEALRWSYEKPLVAAQY